MSRRARVLNHGAFAGTLEERDGTYTFTYDPSYLAASAAPISLTLPKQAQPHESAVLFPFFYGLLSEGSTRQLQANMLRIDETDLFGLLVATGRDVIGSVTVLPEDDA